MIIGKGHQKRIPVEVLVYPSRMEIISYPGPMPTMNKNNTGKISCRR